MNNLTKALAASLLFLSAGVAAAEEDLIEYVVKSCETDLAQFCSTVNPGNGRLLHCVAAHEDQLSGQCAYALYQAATMLEQLAVAVNYFAASCAEDIKTHCSDVAAGEGRLLACLTDKSDMLSGGCSQAISDTVAE